MRVRVTGAWAALLTDWLDSQGHAAPALRASLAPFGAGDVVPAPLWRELLAQAQGLVEGGAPLGLALGARVAPRHIGVLGYLVLASDTLAQALASYQRCERLLYGADLAQVSQTQDELDISWPRDELGPTSNELGIAALVSFLQQQLGRHFAPSRVCFAHPAPPDHTAAYEAFFGCPVRFASPRHGLRFPLSYLSLPMPHREPGLHALLEQQAAALLEALPQSSAFERAIQQSLARLLPEGRASVDHVAQGLHRSTRTLQRHLARSGITWQQLLDRTREQLARQYLSDPALSLAEIALLLGYSEQSAFARAFRRWSGGSPRAWRVRRPPRPGAADDA